jgi:hypothetical protein
VCFSRHFFLLLFARQRRPLARFSYAFDGALVDIIWHRRWVQFFQAVAHLFFLSEVQEVFKPRPLVVVHIDWQRISLLSCQRWSLVYRIESLPRIRLWVAGLTLTKDGISVAFSNFRIVWVLVVSGLGRFSVRSSKLLLLILRMCGRQIRKLWVGRCLSYHRFPVWNLSALTLTWLGQRLTILFELKLPTLVRFRLRILRNELVSMRVRKIIWHRLKVRACFWTLGPIRPRLLSYRLVIHWVCAPELNRIQRCVWHDELGRTLIFNGLSSIAFLSLLGRVIYFCFAVGK